MPDVEVRQWSDRLFAAYVRVPDLTYPVFVGTEATGDEALEWGRWVLSDADGTLENRCGVGIPGGVLSVPVGLTMGNSNPDNRIGRAGAVNTRTPDLTSETGRLPQ